MLHGLYMILPSPTRNRTFERKFAIFLELIGKLLAMSPSLIEQEGKKSATFLLDYREGDRDKSGCELVVFVTGWTSGIECL